LSSFEVIADRAEKAAVILEARQDIASLAALFE
jgi:hypothetical protein